jgi:hypothetical protein
VRAYGAEAVRELSRRRTARRARHRLKTSGRVVLLRRREALGLILLVVTVLVLMAQCGLLG